MKINLKQKSDLRRLEPLGFQSVQVTGGDLVSPMK